MKENVNLFSTLSRVETPFIKVTIGDSVFGVYNKKELNQDLYGAYKTYKISYPNYIKDLSVTKINGVVNTYVLHVDYPITEKDDPNFFEKVLGSVSKTRKIKFSYGDLSAPGYIYREEEATIMKVKSNFNFKSSCISYTIEAFGAGKLLSTGSNSFEMKYAKPSDVIKTMLRNNTGGIRDVFYGMKDINLIEQDNLIASDDKIVKIEMKSNVSILEYLSYLIECMTPCSENNANLIKDSVYSLVIEDDTSGKYNGPYFKVIRSSQVDDVNDSYEIDIGYPSQNKVIDFRIDEDDSYSILFDYASKLVDTNYVTRIDDKGDLVSVYAPPVSSNNPQKDTSEADRTWWTKITQFPIKTSITLKGLVKPSLLMSNLKLNVYFYGRKHVASGNYVVTKQVDFISENGFVTTLNLIRINSDL